jgi:hypothetical protein
MRYLLLIPALALAALLAAPAGAPAQTFFECADFTPASVAAACDRAVPSECRGPDAPTDFSACLRDNGTSSEAVNAAIEAAQRAAGIPVGGVDTGLGGLAAAEDGGGWPPGLLAGSALLALALGGSMIVRARRRAGRP